MAYEPASLKNLYYITPNLIITDRVVILTQDIIDINNISYIIGFFETKELFYDLTLRLNNITSNIVEYGLNGNMDFIDFKFYEWMSDQVESIVSTGKNVLFYCDNDFTTAIPFISLYMTKKCKQLTPTINSVIRLILTITDSDNINKYIKRIEENAYTVLEVQSNKKVDRKEFKHEKRERDKRNNENKILMDKPTPEPTPEPTPKPTPKPTPEPTSASANKNKK